MLLYETWAKISWQFIYDKKIRISVFKMQHNEAAHHKNMKWIYIK